MKHIVFIFTIIFSVSLAYAQRFTGSATYIKSPLPKVIESFKKKLKADNIPDALLAQIISQAPNLKKTTYVLAFDNNQSTFVEKKILSKPTPKAKGGDFFIIGTGVNEELYKNIKQQKYVRVAEISGKRFLITGTLEKHPWKLTGETKKIGRYTCRKATFTKKVARIELNNTIALDDEGIVDEEMIDQEKQAKKATPVNQTIIAWYTPQIPVSNGPNFFAGLPGFVLEVRTERAVFLCTEIVINPKKVVKIKKPTRGQKVTEEEFQKINEKFIEEMKERVY